MAKKKRFAPALKYRWLTRLYGPLMAFSKTARRLFKTTLSLANIKECDVVLDFGCGSANLTIMAKRKTTAAVHGIDIDPHIIEIARKKAEHSGLDIALRTYDGESLPYTDDTFDVVLASLVFHHLVRKQKKAALKEIYRVLKPGGKLFITDFGPPANLWMRAVFWVVQLFDGFAATDDNVKGLLPQLAKKAGFLQVNKLQETNTVLGTIAYYEAFKLA